MAKKKAPEPTVSHVKAAENIIASKTDVPVPTNVFMGAMATAQVHATLALAEQQRIANIIALTRLQDDEVAVGSLAFLFEPDPEHPDGKPWRVRPSIWKALDLS